MRISDWSSDVCSSDLSSSSRNLLSQQCQQAGGRGRRLARPHAGRLLDTAEDRRRGADQRVLADSFRAIGAERLGVLDQDAGDLRHVAEGGDQVVRSEEHTSELQSLMRISYAVFCLKKNK